MDSARRYSLKANAILRKKGNMIEIYESSRKIMILGFKDVKIYDVNDLFYRLKKYLPCTPIQLFDADYIAGKKHLFFAAINALKAFKQNKNISESLEIESLLYASGQRQINIAIEMVGIKLTTSRVAVLIFLSGNEDYNKIEKAVSEIIHGARNDLVLKIEDGDKIKKLKETFHITTLELETIKNKNEALDDALTKAIIERSSILTVKS
jgi:KEOPS complex subunit Cgi121